MGTVRQLRLVVTADDYDAAAATEATEADGATVVAPPTPTPWHSLNARLDGPAGFHLTVFSVLPASG